MSSNSTGPAFAPSSSAFTFGEQRSASPSFDFVPRAVTSSTSSVPISGTSGTTRFTSSPTPSSSAKDRSPRSSPTYHDEHDPNIPLPSVERDTPSMASRQTTPSTTVYTPSASTRATSPRQGSDLDSVIQQVGRLRNLRLASSETSGDPSSQSNTPTPSIHVTPSVPMGQSSRSRASRTDSLVDAVTALRIESPQANSSAGSRLRESRSPTPSRRRRSGSAINRDCHRIEDEDPPQSMFHLPRVQQALENAKSLTSRMVNVLSSSNLHRESESSIGNLHQQALKLKNFQLPSSRVVGLVGDSGVGKSSLINSLLDKMGLARASGSGTACTCAVTEYHFHDKNEIIIYVDYFPLAELKKQFEELLTALRDYQSLPRNSRSRADNDEDDNTKRLQRKADLAKETFKASFGGRVDQHPTILTSMPFENSVRLMVEWAEQLLPRQRGRESFTTIEDCSSRLRDLSSESDSPVPIGGVRTRWPFIKKLQVHLRAYILSKGLIIADLPGLRDLNSARKAITERYVRECHQILVVAKIDRAVTDESIKEIFELAGRANLSKIDVICTRSEEVQIREAKHDWPAERAKIEELEEQIDADSEEISRLGEEIEDFEQGSDLTNEEERELMKLQQDHRRAQKSKEQHIFELKSHVIKLRNDKVAHGLLEEYRGHRIATTLKTFCVSNNLYWDHRGKPAIASLPYLKLSGILELRRYCIGIVAESRLRATKGFISDEIPAFLGSVELWVQAGSGNANAERKQQILNAVSDMEHELLKLTSPISQLSNITRALGGKFNSQIHQCMGQSGLRWTADARQASMYWQGWNEASYKAFCSNHGEYSTPKMGYHCWNEEATGNMGDDMSAVWDNFRDELDAQLEQTKDAISQSFNKILRIALSASSNGSRGPNNSRSAIQTLAATLRYREDLTTHGFEQAVESFYSELSMLLTDAFSSIRTAFIGQLMEHAYHAANMEYGSGSDRRRKNLITGRFSSPDLFNEHRSACRNGFREIAQGLQDAVNQDVNAQVDLIRADLQLLSDENVVLESERNPEFRRKLEAEVDSVEVEVARIGRVFENVS
ncbi:hypothetical protein GQ44DRAFT_767167 [Phaeosphaeriaceae sp. PMI808]|nr:hypothetical protein GQ44DRAFT_767167 [Phaeosphaeriaceae sp. PMI808]